MAPLPGLPPAFATTREGLRALACYAISPARKARTGRIGLRSYEGGIATPPFDDGSRIWVRGDQLVATTGEAVRITTVAAAAALLGIEPSPDPGVGHDLPPFAPDADLAVDHDSSAALGGWYAFAQGVLDRIETVLPAGSAVGEAQLWPEHFDLAVVVTVPGGAQVNVGFSPGDTFHADPYAYVGPHDTSGLDREDGYWNAAFGSFLGHAGLAAAADPEAEALRFVGEGFARLPSDQ